MGLLSEEELKAFEEESQARKIEELQDWKGQTAQLFYSGLVSGSAFYGSTCVLKMGRYRENRTVRKTYSSLIIIHPLNTGMGKLANELYN